MSRFIVTIDEPGLIERPPLSKVIPLPTSTTWGTERERPGGLVPQLHEAGWRGRGLPDPHDAAETLVRQLLLVQHGRAEPGRLGGRDGLLGEPGGRLDVGRDAGQQPRPPAGTGRRHRPLAGGLRSSSSGVRASVDGADRPVRRAVAVHREAEGAEDHALGERRHRLGAADRGHRGGHGVGVRRTAGQGRRRHDAGRWWWQRRPRRAAPGTGRGSVPTTGRDRAAR